MRDHRERLTAELADAESRVAGLAAGLAEIKAASKSSNADDEHDPEGATIAFERQQLSALLDGARRTAADLRAALAQLDSGGYGTCRHCGRSIATERLEARPQATACIECARRQGRMTR
ncbi:MAG: TraR/DksA family transcriptional regulator [Marmoricola sp.]